LKVGCRSKTSLDSWEWRTRKRQTSYKYTGDFSINNFLERMFQSKKHLSSQSRSHHVSQTNSYDTRHSRWPPWRKSSQTTTPEKQS
jgi:hypothetical protein